MSDETRGRNAKRIGGGLAGAALLAALVFWGCSGSDTTMLSGRVAGKDGRPVTWGTVTVIASNNQAYTAPIRPDGSYQITGLPPGPVRVAVTSPDPQQYVGRTQAGGGGVTTGPGVGSGSPAVSAPGGGGVGGGAGGGARNGGGGRADKKQVFGASPTIDPPQVTAPATLPPQGQWFPVAGKYGNPTSSGLSSQTGPRPTRFDITVD